MAFKKRIAALLQNLTAGMYEKENAIALTLLACLSNENIFFLSEVGTSQEQIAKRVATAFKSGHYFNHLLTPKVQIADLIGNQHSGKAGSLNDSSVTFLQNVWNASPDLHNLLVMALNSRSYADGADSKAINTKALVLSDNHIPARNSALQELWDLCLLRTMVTNVSNRQSFDQMLTDSQADVSIPEKSRISEQDYNTVLKLAEKVTIPPHILDVINTIRQTIAAVNSTGGLAVSEQVYISDRKWKKISKLMRVCAVLNDRKAVDEMDCFLIPYCIWDNPSQFTTAKNIVTDAIIKSSYKVSFTWLQKIRQEMVILRASANERKNRSEMLANHTTTVKHIATPATPAPMIHTSAPDSQGPRLIPHRGGYYMINGLELFIEIEAYNGLNEQTFKNVTLYQFVEGEFKVSAQPGMRRIGHGKLESNTKMLRKATDNTLTINSQGDDVEAPVEVTQSPAAQTQNPQTIVAAVELALPALTLTNQQCQQKIGQLQQLITQQRQEITQALEADTLDLAPNLFVNEEINKTAADNISNTRLELNGYVNELNQLQACFVDH